MELFLIGLSVVGKMAGNVFRLCAGGDLVVQLLLSQKEHSDSIVFGVGFKPEAYSNQELAEKRLNELNSSLEDGDGVYYSLEEINLVDGGCIVAAEYQSRQSRTIPWWNIIWNKICEVFK